MKLLKEISEKSLGISDQEILEKNYKLRKSARAILLNDKGEVSIQHITKHDFYKFPGGGVEIGETEEEALKREVLEEVGCEVTIVKELGIVIEYHTSDNLLHISYGYLCKVKGDIGEPQYEEDEIDDEFEPVWKTMDEAIELTGKHSPDESDIANFIITREKAFLEEAKKYLNEN